MSSFAICLADRAENPARTAAPAPLWSTTKSSTNRCCLGLSAITDNRFSKCGLCRYFAYCASFGLDTTPSVEAEYAQTRNFTELNVMSQVSIPIPTALFLDLATFLKEKGDPRDPTEVVAAAIDYWMDNADWKPDLLVETTTHGYQWKQLFLPDGTEIRMQYKGLYSYAKVEGDTITYKGKSVSPASLANTIAGSNRNAWRDLWIKRPGDKEWRLAEECRAEEDRLAESILQKFGQSESDPTEQK